MLDQFLNDSDHPIFATGTRRARGIVRAKQSGKLEQDGRFLERIGNGKWRDGEAPLMELRNWHSEPNWVPDTLGAISLMADHVCNWVH